MLIDEMECFLFNCCRFLHLKKYSFVQSIIEENILRTLKIFIFTPNADAYFQWYFFNVFSWLCCSQMNNNCIQEFQNTMCRLIDRILMSAFMCCRLHQLLNRIKSVYWLWTNVDKSAFRKFFYSEMTSKFGKVLERHVLKHRSSFSFV